MLEKRFTFDTDMTSVPENSDSRIPFLGFDEQRLGGNHSAIYVKTDPSTLTTLNPFHPSKASLQLFSYGTNPFK